MPSKRPLQVADRIKEIIANALESRVKDPMLGFVTITDVRVTGDLQQASIFMAETELGLCLIFPTNFASSALIDSFVVLAKTSLSAVEIKSPSLSSV